MADEDRTENGRIALVTGASRGLGAALAEALAPAFHVVAVARTTGGLEELDDRIKARGGSATLAPMDIADAKAMAALCRSIHDRWGKVDLWCHAAIHTAPLGPVPHIDARQWEKSLKVNAGATATLIAYLTPLLGRDGRAVFLADDRAGQKFFGAYGASKAAQMAMAQSWAEESRRTGPDVVIAAPRPMRSALRATFFPGEDRSALADPAEEARRILAELGL
ncbi:SDR family NAD(P)-dependent oxidoreductase [Pontibaca methylaminivorans]|uniref:NADP-dependent 3-hydroxy acid dehydrogenase YdfG n=1 Tax=Pontibaca methylaminivorans TaxID=515897 RepID=A0A1R3WIC3_9RHOB|nr:SDR family NAD(P)-dependent oxidoreductase [Pontibaca methylaminivorans]SIT76353.1 NADP-dependent 3-hydroxy acid dehydrogenase YdfG [Pontibaca methylaminivorans]